MRENVNKKRVCGGFSNTRAGPAIQQINFTWPNNIICYMLQNIYYRICYISRPWLQKAAILLKKLLKLPISLNNHDCNCTSKDILCTFRKSQVFLVFEGKKQDFQAVEGQKTPKNYHFSMTKFDYPIDSRSFILEKKITQDQNYASSKYIQHNNKIKPKT